MTSLAGQVGVVTGAGRGLGRAVALGLAEQGMTLLLVSRTRSELEAVAREVDAAGGQGHVLAVDASGRAGTTEVARVAATLGEVDLLVHAAARIETTEQRFWEADADEVWGVVETNLRGPLLLSHALLPGMVARGRGRVVTLASRARAATETGTYTGYAVSKRALSLLSESLAGPLTGTGVVVVDVLPGLVQTALTLSMPVWTSRPEQVWDSPDATVDLVVALAQGRRDDLHGRLVDATTFA